MSNATVGAILGEGVRAVVHELRGADGVDRAVKRNRPATPDQWLVEEHACLVAATASGAPGPAGPSLAEVEGRLGLVTALAAGPTMWSVLVDEPGRAAELGRQLAEVQQALFALDPSFALPRQVDRLEAKLRAAGHRHDLDVAPLLDFVRDAAADDRLGICHGDLHPHNVVLTDDGPVLVDWFDACAGGLVAEVARTSVLITSAEDPFRRPGPETVAALARLHDAYLAAALEHLGAAGTGDAATLARWMVVQRAARLAEGLASSDVDEVRRGLAAW